MVLRRCRRLLRDEAMAHEASQETFVQVLRYRDRLRDEAPSSLLHRIATNVCLNLIRAKRRSPVDEAPDKLAAMPSSLDLERQVHARSLLERIFAGVDGKTHRAARLFFLEGLTLGQISTEIGLSVSGVRKRLAGLRRHAAKIAALSAAVILAFVFTHVPNEVRLKGESPASLELYRATADGFARLTAGAKVREGDRVQVSYRVAQPVYAAIYSVDGNGKISLHLPPTHVSAGRHVVDSAFELDDSPHFEKFVLITSPTPFTAEELLANVRAGIAPPQKTETFLLTK